MKFIGLDAGSVSVKVVMLDVEGRLIYSLYRRHKGQPLVCAVDLLRMSLKPDNPFCLNSDYSISVTGSAGRFIASNLGIMPVNEVVAFSFATSRLYPHIRTIIELGGEDSKLIIMGDSHSAKDFAMNSVCAAGTGSFLDQQAERLRLSIKEFSELSMKSKKPPRIAGRCSVFAKSDMIHLQQIATPVEDIVAGLCFAVARNFRGAIARGRKIVSPVAFMGGVAANRGMVRAFREVLGIEEIFVPDEFMLMGAIGAALKDMSDGRHNPIDIEKIERFSSVHRQTEKGHSPLVSYSDGFLTRHLAMTGPGNPPDKSLGKMICYLGVDIGSISTNLALIDEDCRLIAKRYLMTAGRPIEAVKQGLAEIEAETKGQIKIAGVGTTGSGRYMIADYIGADIVKNEITAQATAAAFIDRDVDTIFEIGGQDSKFISLRNGVIVDFEMNKACAAGTGSFLEEQAEKLDISVKGEFQSLAFNAANPCRLGERCTVFMENSLMANLQRGTGKEDLLAGLAYSIVQNYLNRVVGRRHIGKSIFFQGGVAFNKSVVAAFEKYLGREIMVPPNHDVTGAIGMALIAMRHMKEQSGENCPKKTSFKGLGLSQRQHEISSFECKGCPNVCEINRVKVDGEEGHLFYGGRCEKYDVRRKKEDNSVPDLFSLRQELLWKTHKEELQKAESENCRRTKSPGGGSRARIGIPYVFYFHDYLPFWTKLLWELGFDVEVSPPADRHIVDLGLESVLSETCFPVKAAHGHIRYLLEKGVDAIFLPSFVNLSGEDDAFHRGCACPYTQTIPYTAKVAFGKAKMINPVVDLNRGQRFLKNQIKDAFIAYSVKQADISRALAAAFETQREFDSSIKAEGRKIVSGLKERAVVIVGRAYNSFDRGMNLDIPKKLAALGVLAIPMDFLPLDIASVKTDWPNMYWRSGQRILSAARIIRPNPYLYAVYIGNFSCGPDSFITKFFADDMLGKPFLHLEIDEHSADAGAITRCEAFLDSIDNASDITQAAPVSASPKRTYPVLTPGRTVYIPAMSDHSFSLAAAFEFCGVDAQVLPEQSKEAVELGKRYVSGKECYPCAVTTGDMLKKIKEVGFSPERSAFFMPAGSGPCRFGQYNVFHRHVLRDLGLDDIPVFSPNQDEGFYEQLGIVGKDFIMRSWEGIIATDILKKALHETRPYEKSKGICDDIYSSYLGKVYASVKGIDGNMDTLLRKARKDFEEVAARDERKPLIGIVGEIFVRSNSFSNEYLIRKVERLGGEAYLAPIEEWIYYINYIGMRNVLIKKEWSGIISLPLKRFFQKRIEHRLARHFEGLLRTLHEPDTGALIRNASPYLHNSFEGEAILSIGKSIDLINKNASGIINAMPFGCMPGTIVSGLMRGVAEDFDIPCLSMQYDGSESVTSEIQLEAFMDQAKEYGNMKLRR